MNKLDQDYVIDEKESIDSGDYVRAVVNILEDIGEEKSRLETTQKAVLNILEDLEDEKRSAQEANRMKSEFLANMSHELRTPLNSIIGFSELMSDGKVGDIADNHKEYLGDILTSARHLLQLINDVLDLAKVEAGKLEFDAKPVDVASLIKDTCDSLRSIAASRRIDVRVHIAPNIQQIVGDAGRIKQVLYNYLSNALKFTPEDGHVCISAYSEDNDHFRISVRDTGDGIPTDQISRLFVEFEQLDASIGKRHQGTGLGLALTKRIVEAQDGRVGVKSVVGEGSDFFAILPKILRRNMADRNRSVQPVLPINKLPQVEEPKLTASTTLNVLVIEDHPDEMKKITRILTQRGYDAVGAATGAGAIAEIEKKHWDVITLDLILPDMSGSEVLTKIRASDFNATAPVVVLTACPDKSMITRSVQEMLVKPIIPERLLSALERARSIGLSGRHIALVDDDPVSRKMISKVLTEYDYRVSVHDLSDNIETWIVHNQPHIIVLDVCMNKVAGLELLHKLTQNVECKKIPIVMWTASKLTGEDRDMLSVSQIKFVEKTKNYEALLKELSNI